MAKQQAKRPLVIGLVGGVASGKSSVAKAFAALGAEVIDADVVGHEALEDSAVKAAIISAFGSEILLANGSIERRRLGALVFQSRQQLEQLTNITHPWIRSTIRSRLDRLKARDNLPAIILDVSLLLESGQYEADLDVVFFVDGNLEERQRRAVSDRGWEKGELERREAQQLPIADKRQRADAVIDNCGSAEAMQQQVHALWEQYVNQGS